MVHFYRKLPGICQQVEKVICTPDHELGVVDFALDLLLGELRKFSAAFDKPELYHQPTCTQNDTEYGFCCEPNSLTPRELSNNAKSILCLPGASPETTICFVCLSPGSRLIDPDCFSNPSASTWKL